MTITAEIARPRREVCALRAELTRYELVVWTPGNVSARVGSIILTGSPTGLNGEGAGFTAYSSTKAGIHDMARTVAAAYATEGIRVNTVVPGDTETPLVTSISDNAAERAAIVSRIPLGGR